MTVLCDCNDFCTEPKQVPAHPMKKISEGRFRSQLKWTPLKANFKLAGLRIRIADSDPDPDPAFHLKTDPDPAYHFNADPDPAPRQSETNLRPLFYRSRQSDMNLRPLFYKPRQSDTNLLPLFHRLSTAPF